MQAIGTVAVHGLNWRWNNGQCHNRQIRFWWWRIFEGLEGIVGFYIKIAGQRCYVSEYKILALHRCALRAHSIYLVAITILIFVYLCGIKFIQRTNECRTMFGTCVAQAHVTRNLTSKSTFSDCNSNCANDMQIGPFDDRCWVKGSSSWGESESLNLCICVVCVCV